MKCINKQIGYERISYIFVIFVFREFYEPGAIMLEEEAVVISGLLVGLNVIDCNLGIKDEDLDQPVSTAC